MARILIVDDSFVVRRNIETILKKAGHEIIGIAGDGKQALSLYMELRPDLITMDISMPVMDGVDAVKAIIGFDPEAKIVMISALNQKQMVLDAITSGAKHYILKPIDENQMMKVINSVLGPRIDMIDKFQKELESKADNLNPGFHIENKDGKYHIIFGRSIELKQLAMFETAISGLLFMRPLNVVLNFNNIFYISDSSLDSILRQKRRIINNGGRVDIVANDYDTARRIRSMDI